MSWTSWSHEGGRYTSCGRGIEYIYSFPACRMRRLKGCPNISASFLLCNLYSSGWRDRDVGSKCFHYSHTSRTSFTNEATCCWLGCIIPRRCKTSAAPLKFFHTALHLLLLLTCTRVRSNHHHEDKNITVEGTFLFGYRCILICFCSWKFLAIFMFWTL